MHIVGANYDTVGNTFLISWEHINDVLEYISWVQIMIPWGTQWYPRYAGYISWIPKSIVWVHVVGTYHGFTSLVHVMGRCLRYMSWIDIVGTNHQQCGYMSWILTIISWVRVMGTDFDIVGTCRRYFVRYRGYMS